MSPEHTENGDRRGLFDGFEGYKTPGPEEYRAVLTEGLVVLDANVLLNLYRYTDQARDDLLSVLERLGDHLWVPHQVLAEFWRNRESTLRDPRDTEKTARELTAARDKAIGTLRAWANRVSLPSENIEELADHLRAVFLIVREAVDESDDGDAISAARDTAEDRVLARLELILDGRVGPPLEEEAYEQALEEARRRIDEQLPPGYRDRAKDGDRAAGDYLVWEQVLIEAARRGRDVAFVTGDVKEDWWRRDGGELRGPRLELVDELRHRARARLYMLRPATLLRQAGDALAVAVHVESVEDAERVDRLLSEDDTGGGWNLAAVKLFLNTLDAEAPVQAQVVEQAAFNDGYVTRDEVYEIGDYPPDRSLRGFTRPMKRIAQALRDRGVISEDAVDPVVAVYDAGAENPNLADGFEIDAALLPFLLAATQETGS